MEVLLAMLYSYSHGLLVQFTYLLVILVLLKMGTKAVSSISAYCPCILLRLPLCSKGDSFVVFSIFADMPQHV